MRSATHATVTRPARPRRATPAAPIAAVTAGLLVCLATGLADGPAHAVGTGPGPRTLGGVLALVSLDRDPSPYRYRFTRPPQGAITQLLHEEIAFYQSRIARTPQSGLDRAGLAGAYLSLARVTGDLRWYLLAEDTARESLANLPVGNAGAALVLARAAEARHDFPAALRLARAAGPTADALAVAVTASLARGDVSAAEQAAHALLAADPSLRAYALRALVEIARGHDAAAEGDFRRALSLEEPQEVASSTWVRSLYGRFLYQRGRLAEARALFHEALGILPQYPLALADLAVLELRQRQYGAAVDHLTRIVSVTRDAPNVYDHVVLRGLAQAKALQGRPEEAARFWSDAEARLRQDAASGAYGHRRELARLLLTRGRPADLREALSLLRMELTARADPDTLDTMAWALQRAGRLDEARETIRQAMRWGVRDPRYYYRAGAIARDLGDAEEARSYHALVRGLDPAFDARALEISLIGL